MVQITGKYEVVKADNLDTHLLSMGAPKEAVEKVKDFKAVQEFKHNGNKITVDIIHGDGFHSDLILGQEVEEKLSADLTIKTIAHLDGDTLTLKSKYPNGKSETKIHKFSDSGLIVTLQDEDPSTPDAVIVFKRL